MTAFINSQPASKDDAARQVVALTGMVRGISRDIPTMATGRRKSVLIARFLELNEVRVRIIEQFGLQTFAAGLPR